MSHLQLPVEVVEELLADIGGPLAAPGEIDPYLDRVAAAVAARVAPGVAVSREPAPGTQPGIVVDCGHGSVLRLYAVNALVPDADAALARIAAIRAVEVVGAVTELDKARSLAEQLEAAMASRAVIERAKGVLMARWGIGEQEAFDYLRARSMQDNVKVRDLAEAIESDPTGPLPPPA